jgi:hypothetical protein
VTGLTVDPMDPLLYTATFTPAAGLEGTASVAVAAGTFADAAINSNDAGDSDTVDVNAVPPDGSFQAPSFELAAFGPAAGGWTSDDLYPRELADVNGDGRADIVGFGNAGVYVALASDLLLI